MSSASTASAVAAAPTSSSGPGSSSGNAPATGNLQPTLKVMRLYKPKLFTQGASSGSLMPTTLAQSTALQHEFAMSSMLILPDSFGEIFLGNTFSSYISVINQYACDLRDVGLSVTIQCANDRVELHDNRYARTGKLPSANPVKVLPAGSSLDMVVDYPLNQIGNHVLRVGVTYVDPVSNEPKSLRKFYRFAVQNPLVISFKQQNQSSSSSLSDPSACSFVEAQIRNVSKLALFIDSIRFLPLLPFAAEEVETPTTTTTASDVSSPMEQQSSTSSVHALLERGPQTLLNPQEELQRVFRITFDPSADTTTVAALSSHNLGRIHVGWKTSVGEAGSVQSQPVMRKTTASHASDVAVALAEPLPKDIACGVPFRALVRVTNHSARSLQLQLQFRSSDMRGVVCYSLSHQNVGILTSNASVDVPVEFLPTAGGLHAIRGAVCVDVRTGQEFVQDVLAHVLVHAATSPFPRSSSLSPPSSAMMTEAAEAEASGPPLAA